MEQPNYMVRVNCMTYNHAPYITDALNGFCMQETTFPFVCLIIDDASTDGEQEVIKKYLQEHFDLEDKAIVRKEETDDYILTFARHSVNLNCYFAVFFLKYNHYSIKKPKGPYYKEWLDNCKYIALCEGDDYWIVADKLQRQVECLERNKEYGLVCTAANKIYKGKVIERINAKQHDFQSLIHKNRIATNTVLYKRDLLVLYIKEICPQKRNWKIGDYPLFLWFAFNWEIGYLDTTTGVYRILDDSASHFQNTQKMLDFIQNTFEIREFFIEKYIKTDKEKLTKRLKIEKVYSFINEYLLREEFSNAIMLLRNNYRILPFECLIKLIIKLLLFLTKKYLYL